MTYCIYVYIKCCPLSLIVTVSFWVTPSPGGQNYRNIYEVWTEHLWWWSRWVPSLNSFTCSHVTLLGPSSTVSSSHGIRGFRWRGFLLLVHLALVGVRSARLALQAMETHFFHAIKGLSVSRDGFFFFWPVSLELALIYVDWSLDSCSPRVPLFVIVGELSGTKLTSKTTLLRKTSRSRFEKPVIKSIWLPRTSCWQ